MVIILARCTNPETVGTFALVLAITAPVMLLFNMQLRAVIATDVQGRYTLADYVTARVLTSAVATSLIIACSLPIGQSRNASLVLLLITASKGAESISDIFYGYWQLTERMDLVGKSLVIRGVLTLTAFSVSVAATKSLVWGAASLCLGSVVVLIVYDLRRLRSQLPLQLLPINERLGFRLIRSFRVPAPAQALVRLSLPLGLVAMLISLNSAIPRYFIEIYCGKYQLGIFSALSYFIIVGNLLVNAIGQSAVSRLAKMYALPQRSGFRHLLAMLFSISGILSIVSLLAAALFGRTLLAIYGPEYVKSFHLLLIIMGVASTGYFIVVLNYTLNAIGAYKIQVPLFLSITTILVVLCRFTIPRYGLLGASLSLLLAGVLQVVASAVLLAWKMEAAPKHHSTLVHT